MNVVVLRNTVRVELGEPPAGRHVFPNRDIPIRRYVDDRAPLGQRIPPVALDLLVDAPLPLVVKCPGHRAFVPVLHAVSVVVLVLAHLEERGVTGREWRNDLDGVGPPDPIRNLGRANVHDHVEETSCLRGIRDPCVKVEFFDCAGRESPEVVLRIDPVIGHRVPRTVEEDPRGPIDVRQLRRKQGIHEGVVECRIPVVSQVECDAHLVAGLYLRLADPDGRIEI